MGAVRKPKHMIAGLALLAVGAAMMHGSRAYHLGSAREMGPGYFPLLVGGVAVLFAVLLIVLSLQGSSEPLGRLFALRPLLLVTGSTVLFGALLRPLGALGAVFVLAVLGSAAGGGGRWPTVVLLALFLAAASAGLFVYGLGQQLPLVGYWLAG